MRKKVHNLYFLPRSINFSELEPYQEEQLGYEENHTQVERDMLQMISSLSSDKQRCVLMFQILREYGFNLDHDSCAQALGVQWRWYMRVKAKVREKLERFKLLT